MDHSMLYDMHSRERTPLDQLFVVITTAIRKQLKAHQQGLV
jgi:hypothetical protein